jgi:hypothetical protein
MRLHLLLIFPYRPPYPHDGCHHDKQHDDSSEPWTLHFISPPFLSGNLSNVYDDDLENVEHTTMDSMRIGKSRFIEDMQDCSPPGKDSSPVISPQAQKGFARFKGYE